MLRTRRFCPLAVSLRMPLWQAGSEDSREAGRGEWASQGGHQQGTRGADHAQDGNTQR